MKLYTEEQVRSMLNRAKIFDGEVKSNFLFILSEQDILAPETPIELPTDEEIMEYAEKSAPTLELEVGFVEGAKWYRKQLKKKNNGTI